MKIVTDSTADLSAQEYEENGIAMVPLSIHLGDRTWRDFWDVEPEAYYKMLRTAEAFPSTSQPSPQDFIEAYAPWVERGEPILSLNMSSRLSGTFQSANLARTHFPGDRIEVVDSRQTSLGLGLAVLLCAEKAKTGASFDEVVEFARSCATGTETYFSLDSLEYLRRGGRIGKAQAFLGTLIKIKPLLRLAEGEIQPLEKVRTTERVLGRLVEFVKQAAEGGGTIRLSVAESDNHDTVTTLIDRLLDIPGVSLVYRCKLGGVITSHTGPGPIAISFIRL
jgi:DegV family protein with EDD domain